MSVLIGIIKVVFLLGFLVLIHEGGHFIVAKLCKVKVREFSIGFGTSIFSKQGPETKYSIRIIPLGGYVDMLGETEEVNEEGSFSNAKISKRIAIVVAGALVNIIFGLAAYFILMSVLRNNIYIGLKETGILIESMKDSIVALFTGNASMEQMTGPVGISELVVKTSGIAEFIYLLSVISVSLGVTNLLPIPALDGGKILLLIIEWIRGKKLSEETEIKIQSLGFAFLILLSLYVSFNDITRLFN